VRTLLDPEGGGGRSISCFGGRQCRGLKLGSVRIEKRKGERGKGRKSQFFCPKRGGVEVPLCLLGGEFIGFILGGTKGKRKRKTVPFFLMANREKKKTTFISSIRKKRGTIATKTISENGCVEG